MQARLMFAVSTLSVSTIGSITASAATNWKSLAFGTRVAGAIPTYSACDDA